MTTAQLDKLKTLAAKPARLTMSFVKAELKARGMTFRKTEWVEFRVNVAGAGEVTAYYTTDLEDALMTGHAMADFEEKKARELQTVTLIPGSCAAHEPQRYILGSSELAYAPGLWRFAQVVYRTDDRPVAIALMRDTWTIPEYVAIALCEGVGRIVGETVEIEI